MPMSEPHSPPSPPVEAPASRLHRRSPGRAFAELPAALARLHEEPALLLAWLRYAWRTQLALAVTLPVLLFVAPAIIDVALDRIEPVSTAWPKKVIGIVSGERQRRALHRARLMQSTQLGSAVLLLLLFCYELPEALARSRAARGAGPRIAPGATVGGRYQLLEVLGEGGVGTVHLAEDLVLHRRVALKQLQLRAPGQGEADEAAAARFRDEAQALARVSHPNIVQIFDLIDEADRCWMAMELVEGGDLHALLQREGPLPWRRALDFVVPLADALSCLHALGIVHRDVKPLNVLLTPDGTPKLADFGLAKSARSSVQTHADILMGSPAYLSPEQIQGSEAGPCSDVYALGVMLYELLTGRPPFEGDPASVLVQHAVEEPTPPSRVAAAEIPAEVDALVLALLDKRPECRPGSGGDIAKRCRDAGWGL